MKRLLLAAALTLLTATSAMAQTVVLVRHAEKADQSADPVLSEAGQVRAAALAEAVAPLQIDTVFVTPLQRTRLTAEPAAEAAHLTPTVIAFEGGTPAHVAAVAARIRELPKTAKVLVVGHSNTIPLITRALGVEAADMADCEYDRLTTVILGDGDTAVVLNSRYGAASTCE